LSNVQKKWFAASNLEGALMDEEIEEQRQLPCMGYLPATICYTLSSSISLTHNVLTFNGVNSLNIL